MGKRNEKCLKRPQSNTINKVTKETPSNPIFISENCLIMMILVLLAIVIAAIVKANELQTTNDEKDATIDSLEAETSKINQKATDIISNSRHQLKVKEILIGKLTYKIEGWRTDSEDLNKLLGKKSLEISLMAKEAKEGQEKMINLTQEKEKLNTDLKINNECQTKINSRNKVIDNMNIKLMQSDENAVNLREKIVEEESRNSLLIEENNDINKHISQNIEKIKFLTQKENEINQTVQEKDAALEKLTNQLNLKLKESKAEKVYHEKVVAQTEIDLEILKKDIEAKITTITKEKDELVQTINQNRNAFNTEKSSLEKQHQDEMANVRFNVEQSEKEMKIIIDAKQKEIVEKDSTIHSLKDQNSQMSKDFAKYSDDIKNKTQTFQKEKEKCENESHESEKSLSRRLDIKEKETQRINEEKSTMEVLIEQCKTKSEESEQRYKTNLEEEKKNVKNILEDKVNIENMLGKCETDAKESEQIYVNNLEKEVQNSKEIIKEKLNIENMFEQCKNESKESEQSCIKVEKAAQNVQDILEEKATMENNLKSKYEMLKKEKEEILIDYQDNINLLQDNYQKDKDNLNNEKLVFEGKLDDSNQEITQLIQKMKVVQEDLEKCVVDKKYDEEMLETLDSIIIELNNEKNDLESQFSEVKKELAKIKIKDVLGEEI